METSLYKYSLHLVLEKQIKSIKTWVLGDAQPAETNTFLDLAQSPTSDHIGHGLEDEHTEDEEDDLYECAPRATSVLAKLFLSHRGKDQRYRDFSRGLKTFSLHLEKQKGILQALSSSSSPSETAAEVNAVLEDIEALFVYLNVPCHHNASLFPQLMQLGANVPRTEISQYIEHILQEKARDKIFRKLLRSYCDQLDRFNDSRTTTPAIQDTNVLPPAKPNVCPVTLVDQIHHILKEHLSHDCGCAPRPRKGDWRHLFRVLLQPAINSASGFAIFELMISQKMHDHSREFSISSRQSTETSTKDIGFWRDVYLKMRLPKQVNFSNVPDPSGDKHGECRTIEIEDCPRKDVVLGSFCAVMPKDKYSRLRLGVESQRLWYALRQELSKKSNEAQGNVGITLADFLTYSSKATPAFDMSFKMSLAYTIAHMVWEYYDSSWMTSAWNSDTITFIKEQRPNTSTGAATGVNPMKPYLAVRFSGHGKDTPEFAEDGRAHAYPRIFMLGVLLLEIGLGLSVKVLRRREESGSPNEEFQIAQQLLQKTRREPPRDFNFPGYWKAVDACFNLSLLDGLAPTALGEEQTPQQGLNMRRDVLYTRVVHPLSKLLDSNEWRNTLKFQELLTLPASKISTASLEEIRLARQPPAVTAEQNALAWLQRLSNMSTELGEGDRVRIAILDTGFAEDSGLFEINGPCGWKSFVEDDVEDGKPVDTDGHGTHLLGLIMQLVPKAEVIVARVAKNSKELEGAGDKVALAIQWAHANKADIVSMSLGFPGFVLSIDQAIHSVLTERQVLFFAAAANEGANVPGMFPASHDNVIAMRATDDQGDFPKWNPTKRKSDTLAFGTLGVDVPLDDDLGYPARSGTSVATAIAAAYAAILLSYARGKCTEPDAAVVAQKLLERKGMLEMFESLSERTMKTGYLSLKPWDVRELSDQARWAKLVVAMGKV